MHQEGRLINDQHDVEYNKVVSRLVRGKGSKLQRHGNQKRQRHTCSHSTCNPESESHLIAQQNLEGPPVSSNVYLCNMGEIHICSESSCSLFAFSQRQTCPISGIQWANATASYDKNDYRTWRTGGTVQTSDGSHLHHLERLFAPMLNNGDAAEQQLQSPDAKRTKTTKAQSSKRTRKATSVTTIPSASLPPSKVLQRYPNKSTFLERARDIVDCLLYSNNRRRCNLAALAQFREQANKATQTYVESRRANRQLPYMTDIARLQGFYLSQTLPLIEYPRDEARKEYYAHVIYQVWQKILLYRKKTYGPDGEEAFQKLDVETVAMGVLYTMRDGLQCMNVIVLPMDSFLLASLPLVSDLSFFDKRKNRVTQGQRLLVDVYTRAATYYRIHPEELKLDPTALPAPLSIDESSADHRTDVGSKLGRQFSRLKPRY